MCVCIKSTIWLISFCGTWCEFLLPLLRVNLVLHLITLDINFRNNTVSLLKRKVLYGLLLTVWFLRFVLICVLFCAY